MSTTAACDEKQPIENAAEVGPDLNEEIMFEYDCTKQTETSTSKPELADGPKTLDEPWVYDFKVMFSHYFKIEIPSFLTPTNRVARRNSSCFRQRWDLEAR